MKYPNLAKVFFVFLFYCSVGQTAFGGEPVESSLDLNHLVAFPLERDAYFARQGLEPKALGLAVDTQALEALDTETLISLSKILSEFRFIISTNRWSLDRAQDNVQSERAKRPLLHKKKKNTWMPDRPAKFEYLQPKDLTKALTLFSLHHYLNESAKSSMPIESICLLINMYCNRYRDILYYANFKSMNSYNSAIKISQYPLQLFYEASGLNLLTTSAIEILDFLLAKASEDEARHHELKSCLAQRQPSRAWLLAFESLGENGHLEKLIQSLWLKNSERDQSTDVIFLLISTQYVYSKIAEHMLEQKILTEAEQSERLIRAMIGRLFAIPTDSPLIQPPFDTTLYLLTASISEKISDEILSREDMQTLESSTATRFSQVVKAKKKQSKKNKNAKNNLSSNHHSDSNDEALNNAAGDVDDVDDVDYVDYVDDVDYVDLDTKISGTAFESAGHNEDSGTFNQSLPHSGLESFEQGGITYYNIFRSGRLIRGLEVVSIARHVEESNLYSEFLHIADNANKSGGVNFSRIYAAEQAWKNACPYHQFAKRIDSHLRSARYVTKEKDGRSVHFATLRGTMFFPKTNERVLGRFEYAFERDGRCFHRFFRPAATKEP